MPSDADAVLAECVANPDDDAPRLVWADLVGGERGELVVIQCDLARGGLSHAEARARRARESELLDRNAVAWAGDLTQIAMQWSFRRGFIESARANADQLDVTKLPPLLSSISIAGRILPERFEETVAKLAHLRGFGFVEPQQTAAYVPVKAFRELRAFAITGAYLERIALQIISSNPIKQLWFRAHTLDARNLIKLLDAAPDLDSLAITEDDAIPDVLDRPLRALRIGTATFRSSAELQRCRAAATLEHLGFELAGPSPRLADNLAPLEKLKTIEIEGRGIDYAIRSICTLSLPALRTLRLRGDVTPDLVELVTKCFGDRLEVFELNEQPELMHATAMFELGRPRYDVSTPARFERIDQPGETYFDLPARPGYETVIIGRSIEAPIRLASSSIARHHARVHWRNGKHEIEDLASTNGIVIRGERVQRAALSDGDILTLGDAVLRYRIVHSVGGT